jgi:hypothetical protein
LLKPTEKAKKLKKKCEEIRKFVCTAEDVARIWVVGFPADDDSWTSTIDNCGLS